MYCPTILEFIFVNTKAINESCKEELDMQEYLESVEKPKMGKVAPVFDSDDKFRRKAFLAGALAK